MSTRQFSPHTITRQEDPRIRRCYFGKVGRMTDHLYLAHHGIKGMKWGVRRFQNPDGSLTSAGKARYGDSTGTDKKRDNLALNAKGSKRMVSALQRNVDRSAKKAATSRNVLKKAFYKTDELYTRAVKKSWEKEAAKDQKKLDKYDKKVKKKRHALEQNLEVSEAMSQANKRRAEKAIARAGKVKVSILAPGVGLVLKGAQRLEAMQASGEQARWEREAERDQKRLDRFNARHGNF